MDRMDVVIPVAAKDIPKLLPCVQHLQRHAQTPIRNFYVVARSAPQLVAPLSRSVGAPLIGVDERGTEHLMGIDYGTVSVMFFQTRVAGNLVGGKIASAIEG